MIKSHNGLLFYLTLFVLNIAISQCIYQSCSFNADCPVNSYCGQKNYCVCEQNWIVNCSTPSVLLENYVNANLDDSYQYFTIRPSQLGVYMKFIFGICIKTDEQWQITATIWGETGYLKSLTDNNKYMSIDYQSQCKIIETTYFEFSSQPNGKAQQLYLGLKLSNQTGPLSVKVQVTEEQSLSPQLYKTIVTIMMGVLSLVCLFIIGYCIYKRRNITVVRERQKKEKIINSISHFEEFMPKLSASRIKDHLQCCSVCLSDIKPSDMVRITTCQHVFHCDCIDSWCKKNLSCPICRTQLDRQNCQKQSQQISISGESQAINRVCQKNKQQLEMMSHFENRPDLMRRMSEEVEEELRSPARQTRRVLLR